MRHALSAFFLLAFSLATFGADASAMTLGKSPAKARYASLIATFARANGVPLALAHAVVSIESRYNAGARAGPARSA